MTNTLLVAHQSIDHYQPNGADHSHPGSSLFIIGAMIVCVIIAAVITAALIKKRQ